MHAREDAPCARSPEESRLDARSPRSCWVLLAHPDDSEEPRTQLTTEGEHFLYSLLDASPALAETVDAGASVRRSAFCRWESPFSHPKPGTLARTQAALASYCSNRMSRSRIALKGLSAGEYAA